ncbi:histidine phosphatase family protein [Pectinatus frisingensis]|uniref:histidine phosphatase family protein n=1 Tax=Pectinatus frisingensis TaxID=865 RepID=UPI0018C50D74|nr:histidine phosphatase family protein [Pectinatus frisingensis]
MVTKIVLIRHGRTAWNIEGRFQGQSDTKLLTEGVAQAKLLAEKFPLNNLDALYSSDLQRAKCTAELIADKFNLSLQLTEDLREMNFGQWEGILFNKINERWPGAIKHFFDNPDSIKIPDGENFQQVQNRGMRVLRKIIQENSGRNVAIVAHGAINRAILSCVTHIPFEYIWSVGQSNTAYNILSYDDEYKKFYIHTINNTSHLM